MQEAGTKHVKEQRKACEFGQRKSIVPTTRQYCRLHEVMSQNSTGARDKCTQLDLLQGKIIRIYNAGVST